MLSSRFVAMAIETTHATLNMSQGARLEDSFVILYFAYASFPSV